MLTEEITDDGLGTKTQMRKDLLHSIETIHIEEVASQRTIDIETGLTHKSKRVKDRL